MVQHPRDFQTRQEFGRDEFHRHWSPESEIYAPADVLLQYLTAGWSLDQHVAVETVYYAGYRRSDVYYFTLEHDGVSLEMPVLATPVVFKLIEDRRLTTLPINVDREEQVHPRRPL